MPKSSSILKEIMLMTEWISYKSYFWTGTQASKQAFFFKTIRIQNQGY